MSEPLRRYLIETPSVGLCVALAAVECGDMESSVFHTLLKKKAERDVRLSQWLSDFLPSNLDKVSATNVNGMIELRVRDSAGSELHYAAGPSGRWVDQFKNPNKNKLGSSDNLQGAIVDALAQNVERCDSSQRLRLKDISVWPHRKHTFQN